MKNDYCYFENKDCEYYPCHKGEENINCMFCYCPMYFLDKCLGNPQYITSSQGKVFKSCDECTFPHNPDNYEAMVDYLEIKAEISDN